MEYPRHIAFIMDGNGRWAEKQGKSRNYGHQKGADVLDSLIDHGFLCGAEVLSFYAFSTENWQRPEGEVKKLMSILKYMLKTYLPKLIRTETRLIVSGDLSRFTPSSQKSILSAMQKTEKFYKHTVNICVNYGSRAEILMAANNLIKKGEVATEENFSQELYTKGLPDVDLVVRTSGEQRLSNFLLWQSAYAELYFTDVYWPDFSNEEYDKAVEWFMTRKRRFGKV